MQAFSWFITIEILGLLALPVTCTLFKRLPDRGYAFGKALSILVITFILWLAVWAHILPNSRWSIFLIIVILAAGSIFLFWRRRHEIKSFISENRRIIIITEALFLLAFVFWTIVRAYNPDILFGEKYMDIAFINSILRTDHFPPYDPWISGYNMGYYYYFGYLIVGTLTKLTGIASAVTFNLSIALIFALIVIGAFSIVYNLVRLMNGGFKTALGFGLVGAGFIAVVSNLEGVLELMHSHNFQSARFWEWVDIGSLHGPGAGNPPYASAKWYPTDWMWWWRASRVVGTTNLDYTINEVPFWSSLFADLHAHLIVIPFALLNLAIGLELFLSPVSLGLKWIKRNWGKLILISICLGALVFLNSWELPTYTILLIIFIALGEYVRQGSFNTKWLTNVITFCVPLVLLAVIFYLPYTMKMLSSATRLVTTAGGGEAILGPIAPYYGIGTRPFHFFLFWGVFAFIGMSFVLSQTWNILQEKEVQLKQRIFRLLRFPARVHLRQMIIVLFGISILLVIAREFAGIGNTALRTFWGLILGLTILYIMFQSAQMLFANIIRSKWQLAAAIFTGTLIFSCLPLIIGAATGIGHLYFMILPSVFLFALACFALSQFYSKGLNSDLGRWGIIGAILFPLIPITLWGAEVNWQLVSRWAEASPAFFLDKFGTLLPALIVLTLTLILIFSKRRTNNNDSTRVEKAPIYALILIFLGLLLLIGCELFNVDDRGSGSLERVTTVFKLYLQAWVFLGIGSAFGLYHLASRWRLFTSSQLLSALIYCGNTLAKPFKRPLSGWAKTSLFGKENRGRTLTIVGSVLMVAAVWITVAVPSAVFGMVALFILGAFIAFFDWTRTREENQGKTEATNSIRTYIWHKSALAVWWAACIVLIAGSCVFSLASVIDKTNEFSGDATLNGMAWMERNANYRSDYEAISWLRENVDGAPVIVEAVGSHYNGWFWVSAYTGLPTIVGRWGQVPTWILNITEEEARDREMAAETIYTSTDTDRVKEVLNTYNVTYVYIGYREHNKYGANLSQNFSEYMDVAFENEGVTIYRVRE